MGLHIATQPLWERGSYGSRTDEHDRRLQNRPPAVARDTTIPESAQLADAAGARKALATPSAKGPRNSAGVVRFRLFRDCREREEHQRGRLRDRSEYSPHARRHPEASSF